MSSRRMTCMVLRSRHGERHQRDHARPADGRGDLALVLGTVPRDPPRHQLATIGDEVLQQGLVLVVDLQTVVPAELALLAAPQAPLLVASIVARAGCPGARA